MREITSVRQYVRNDVVWLDVRLSDKARERKSAGVSADVGLSESAMLQVASAMWQAPLNVKLQTRLQNSQAAQNVYEINQNEQNVGAQNAQKQQTQNKPQEQAQNLHLNFDNLLKIYIDEHADTKKSTKINYVSRIKTIKKYFGARDIRDIHRDEFAQFLGAREKDAIIYRNFINSLIKATNDELDINIKRIKWRDHSAKDEELQSVKALSFDELLKLLSVIDDEELKNYVEFACASGLRIGEMLGLKFSDIDLEKQTINVCRQLNEMGEITNLKTRKSRRIELLNAAKDALLKQKEIKFNHKNTYDQKRAKKRRAGFVFTYHRKVVSDLWRDALKTAGLSHRVLYNTRHTFATLMLTNNEPTWWVSKMLGHADEQMIYKHYFDYLPKKTNHGAFLSFGGAK